MPLVKSKSKQAFKANIKAEVGAGKKVKQAVAIAYSVKRKAGGKKAAPKKIAPKKKKKGGYSMSKYEATRRKVFGLPKDY